MVQFLFLALSVVAETPAGTPGETGATAVAFRAFFVVLDHLSSGCCVTCVVAGWVIFIGCVGKPGVYGVTYFVQVGVRHFHRFLELVSFRATDASQG